MQPLLQWQSNRYCIFWVCVFRLTYPSRNALVPCCHLRPVWLYFNFPHFLITGTIFEKKNEHSICVLIFSTTFVWNISHSKKKWARYDQKYVYIGLHVKCPLFLSDFNETWTFWTDFRKTLNIKFHENPFSGSRVVAYGQTDGRRDRIRNLIVAFLNFTNAPKKRRLSQ